MDANPTLPDDASNPETERAIDDLQTHADRLSDETDLSKRQAMVVLLSNQGLSTNTIADALDLSSPSTVSEHRNAAEGHIERSKRLAALSDLAPIAGGQHLLYTTLATVSWTPANYGGGPNGEDLASITIYENTYDGEVIWKSEARTLHGDSEMQSKADVRRYPREAAEGRDENESLLIEEALWTPEFHHLAEAVAVANVIDDSGLSGGHCFGRIPHYHGEDYTMDEIEDAIICDLADPLSAAHVLLQSEHDLERLEQYGDLSDL